MKILRIVVGLILLGMLSGNAHADTKISALPSGTTLTGSEALPMQQTGQCASTGGTCKTTPAAIAAYVVSPASAGQVLYKGSGAVAGSANFTWDAINSVLTLNGAGGAIIDSATAQPVTIVGGNALTDGTAATISVSSSGTTGAGGAISANAGNAVTSGAGGSWQLNSGSGAGTNQPAGSISITTGSSTGSAAGGTLSLGTHGTSRLQFAENGTWLLNGGGAGTAGQPIVSNGSSSVPGWGTVTGSGNSVLATSPSIVSPNLGTPTSIVLTNATGLPYSALPTQVTNTILCNSSGSTAVPSACNPLAIANMMSAVIAASVIASSNITLSGIQTVDGISVGGGQVVLVAGQTTGSQDGLYISASGAWTRAANFPAGYVIAQNCDMIVFIDQGTANQGVSYRLQTSSGAITIGTSNQNWNPAGLPVASTTVSGLARRTTEAQTGKALVVFDGLAAAAVNDCVSFTALNGSIDDLGNAINTTGPCVTSDANGHPRPQNASGTAPTVNRGAVACAAQDNTGCITGLTVTNTTVTLTFNAAFPYTPACSALSNATTPFSISITAASASAVTFTFAALAGTTTLYYSCS